MSRIVRSAGSALVTGIALACRLAFAAVPGSPETPVAIADEPLHHVRYESAHFRVYTNWIEPGVWTLYHEHRFDQLSVIAADTSAATQLPGEKMKEQRAPAGTVVFFPYADLPTAYVHRVGARGSTPFVNIGLDFRDPLSGACANEGPSWQADGAELRKSTRRGQAYRLQLPGAGEVDLPNAGRGLLLVPLSGGNLELDGQTWEVEPGGFRFFERERPARLRNPGSTAATVMVVDAC
ncbi:MAG: hypothetical protein ACK2U9_07135 [Anaerolineae bacterium]